jgi:hypothetical protein
MNWDIIDSPIEYNRESLASAINSSCRSKRGVVGLWPSRRSRRSELPCCNFLRKYDC